MSDEQKQTTSDYKASNDGSKMRLQMGIPVEAPAEKAAAPIHRTGGITHRMTVRDGVVGPLEVSSAMGGTRQAGPDPVKATAVGSHGQRISLNEAQADTVVDLGGALGSTKASVWADLGYLVKDTVNGGYRVVGEQQNPSTPPTAKQPETAAPAKVEPAVDLSNVKGTSDAVDAALKTVQELAPVRYEQMVESAARGQAIDYTSIARDIGAERGDGIEAVVTAHREAGVQVLKNIDSSIDPVAYERWAQRDPGKASDIIRAVMQKNMGPLAASVREYSQQRTAMIEQKVEQANVQTTRIEGKLHISRASLGLSPTKGAGDFKTQWISLQQAIRDGHVEIAD